MLPADGARGVDLNAIQQLVSGNMSERDSNGACLKDSRQYTVTADVRSAFPDKFIVTCTEEDDQSVVDRIEHALNAAFPYVANTWDGKASFEALDFDFNQDVTNVDGFRRHRDLRILQTQICPARTTDCPTSFDSCRFSCGLLVTTNCNGMDVGGIDQLENYLSAAATAALRNLDLKCLGFTSELIALVRLVGDP